MPYQHHCTPAPASSFSWLNYFPPLMMYTGANYATAIFDTTLKIGTVSNSKFNRWANRWCFSSFLSLMLQRAYSICSPQGDWNILVPPLFGQCWDNDGELPSVSDQWRFLAIPYNPQIFIGYAPRRMRFNGAALWAQLLDNREAGPGYSRRFRSETATFHIIYIITSPSHALSSVRFLHQCYFRSIRSCRFSDYALAFQR